MTVFSVQIGITGNRFLKKYNILAEMANSLPYCPCVQLDTIFNQIFWVKNYNQIFCLKRLTVNKICLYSNSMSKTNLTPMMKQYETLRSALPEKYILFFRLGDFYEMFFEESLEVAAILNIAHTKNRNVDCAGIPFYKADDWFKKLNEAGYAVALAVQTSEPKAGEIVERKIGKIIYEPNA